MRTPYHRHWALRRTGRRLRQSDPHLAGMLAVFTRLTAGEAITSCEQTSPLGDRMRCVAAGLGSVMAVAAARLSCCARWVLSRAATAWDVVRCWFGGAARTGVGAPAPSRDPSDPGRSM
jgi:hypothetical protein